MFEYVNNMLCTELNKFWNISKLFKPVWNLFEHVQNCSNMFWTGFLDKNKLQTKIPVLTEKKMF